MGFDVKKYMKEQGIGYSSNYYSNKLKELDDNVTNYTATDYKRNKEYYTLKRDIAQNVIDQNVYAPNLSRLDDMMENQNEYIEKYGKTGFNSLYSIYKTNAAQDIDNISSIISYKTTGLSSDILNSSTWLAKNVAYNETDPDDMLRRAAGVVPASFDAKAIVNYAKEILKQKDENIADEIKSKYAQKETSWENVFPDSKTITPDDIKEAIKIINEHTGETSVDEYRKNLGMIQSVKDNPDMLDYFSPGMSTSIMGVDLENLSAKEAASFAAKIKNAINNPPQWIQDNRNRAVESATASIPVYIELLKQKGIEPDVALDAMDNIDLSTQEGISAYKELYSKMSPVLNEASEYEMMKAANPELIDAFVTQTLDTIDKTATSVYGTDTEAGREIADVWNIRKDVYSEGRDYGIKTVFPEGGGQGKTVIVDNDTGEIIAEKRIEPSAKGYVWINPETGAEVENPLDRFASEDKEAEYRDKVGEYLYNKYLAQNEEYQREIAEKANNRSPAGQIALRSAIGFISPFDKMADLYDTGRLMLADVTDFMFGTGTANSTRERAQASIDRRASTLAEMRQKTEDVLQKTEDYKPWHSAAADIGESVVGTASEMAAAAILGGAMSPAKMPSMLGTKSLVAAVAPNAITKGIFALSFGDNVVKYQDMGLDMVQATFMSTIESAATARIESLGGIAGEGTSKVAGSKIFRALLVPIEEMGEEAAQGFVTALSESMISGENPFDNPAMQQWSPEQALRMGISVTLSTAIFGAANVITQAGGNIANTLNQKNAVGAAQTLITDIDAALAKGNISDADAQYLNEQKTVAQTVIDMSKPADKTAQTVTDAYNNTAVMEQIDETSRAEQQGAERDFLKNPIEMTSAEQDYEASKADIVAEQIKAVTEEIEQLKKTSKIKIDKNSTLTETIEMLANTRADVQLQMQELKDLDMPSISITDLTPTEIRDIGKAIANRSNTVNDLKRTITQINQRIRTERGKAEKSLIKKIKDYRAVKGTTEFKTFMDNWYDAVDTQARSITDAKAADLQRMRDFAYAVYTQNGLEIPQSVKDGFNRLEKVSISELSDADIDMINSTLDMAKHQSDVETGQANTVKGQTIQQSADAIRDGKAELPVNTKVRRVDNYFKSPLSRAHAIGQAFVDTYITPILEGTRTQGKNNYWVDTNALNELNKMFQKEFGEHKISKQSQKINDRYVGEHTRAELLALYAIAQDIDGFEALHEKGYDRVVMQTYIKNFQQTYPDLYRGYELMRKVFDYYSDKTNHAYRHINGTDYVTERMLRRNPMYYPLNKDGTYFTAPTADNKTSNKIVPTFTMKRVGGGDIVLANPLWVIKNYAQQANRYVSFAPAVYDATNLTNTEQLHSIFSEMGSDSNGNVIEATYWKDWLTRVAKGNPSIDRVMSKLRSKIAGAKLSLSPTIPLKQAASFYGALKYVDAQYLLNPTVWTRAAQTLVTKEGRSALYQSEPILYDRIHQKQSSLEVGELTGRIFNARAVRAMDALTVTAIYHAVQDMAKAKGIDAQKVYQQALWETQPMYDMAFRSDVQNSETGRWLLMFSTQQYQQQNMMRQIGQDVKQGNYGRAARGTAGLALNVAGFGALSWALFKLLYGRKDDENSLLKEMVNSALATVSPILSRAYSDYELSSTVIDVYNDIVSASKRAFGKAFKGESESYTWYGVIMSFARPLAEAFGVPLTNAEKWLGRAMSAMIPEFDYDDWKKHESVSDKVKEYVTGESSQYPEQLPEGKSQLNELYFDMVQGETEGDFERLLELYLEVGDKGKRQNITALLTSIRNKIERELEKENQEYTEEELDRELEKYVDGVLDFFLEDKK